jgi:hypothetical protein
MLLTVHAAAGALIGQQIGNPFFAFVLAFASHFILDMIPHGDQDWIDEYKGNQKEKVRKIIILVALDVLALFILLVSKYFFDSFTPTLNIVAGIMGSVLPDLLVGIHELSERHFRRFYRFHFAMHDLIKYQPSTASGLFFQIIILGALLFAF